MGVDYCLACDTCKEFIELHKWSVVEDAGTFLVHAHYKPHEYESQLSPEDSPYPFADAETRCKKILVTSDDIRRALSAGPPEQDYIRDLTPIVEAFAATHEGHRIFLRCDLGDTDLDPWSPNQPGFADWFEVSGPFQWHHYLPRNLTDTRSLRDWNDVLVEMKDDWPFMYAEDLEEEIHAIRTAFERRITGRAPPETGMED
ncbi:MAG: hypothetical protein CMJ48_08005 [Planctomycetaceae bacterium]|nr:hypothetical protein [Planctomycetaceae bacterium]